MSLLNQGFSRGTCIQMLCGCSSTTGKQARSLVRFDSLPALPAGAVITSAYLELYGYYELNTSNWNISAHRVKVAWGEGNRCDANSITGESCWTYRIRPTTWQTGGCQGSNDREDTPDDTLLWDAPKWYSFDVTASLQYFYGGGDNNGWVLSSAGQLTPNSQKYFRTRNYTTIAQRPILIINYNLAPTIISVIPNTGSELGGTSVTIAGTDFQSGATVTFDGDAATNVVFVDSTEITCDTPAHAAGAVDVVLTNPDTGFDTLVGGFTYIHLPTIYYVDGVGGSDGNTGLSWGQAWKTLSYANTQVVDNDSVFVKAATYNEQFTIAKETLWQAVEDGVIVDGTSLSGNAIELSVSVTGLEVTMTKFNVQGFTSGSGFATLASGQELRLFTCVGRSNQRGMSIGANSKIILEGTCEAKANSSHGVQVAGGGGDLEFDGILLAFLNGGSAINVTGSGGVLTGDMNGSKFFNNANGITWSTGASFTIRDAEIYNNTFDGIYFNELADGVLIEFCKIYGNGRDGISTGSLALSVEDIRIRRNQIYGNGRRGINIDADNNVFEIKIYRNTLWGNGGDGIYFYPSATTDCFVSSNIIASSGGYGVKCPSASYSALLRYNCVWGSVTADVYDGSDREAEDVGVGNFDQFPGVADPLLPTPDFSLVVGSPCIDAGEEEPS